LIHSPHCGDGHPVNYLLEAVYGQKVAQRLYDAGVAGVGFSSSVTTNGLSLSVYGYSPKLRSLLQEVGSDWGNPEFWKSIPESMLSNVKERIIRSLRSWQKERPDSQASTLLSYLLQQNVRLPSETLPLVEETTLSDLQKRAADMLRWSRMTTHVHGDVESINDLEDAAAQSMMKGATDASANAAQAKVVSIRDQIKSCLRLPAPEEVASLEAMQASEGFGLTDKKPFPRLLPQGTHRRVAIPVLNEDDPNSALVTHFQFETRSVEVVSKLMVMRKLLGEPMFTELRTREQLGYVVGLDTSSFGRGKDSMRGLTARVLSQRFNPIYIEVSVTA
jgi:insulysin